jgi:hypothetical protein
VLTLSTRSLIELTSQAVPFVCARMVGVGYACMAWLIIGFDQKQHLVAYNRGKAETSLMLEPRPIDMVVTGYVPRSMEADPVLELEPDNVVVLSYADLQRMRRTGSAGTVTPEN